MRSRQGEVKRVLIARLEAGEDLLAALTQLVVQEHVGSGSFQAMGVLRRARLGTYVERAYHWVEHAEELEIASCVGNIAIKEGKPFVHCHAVLSDHKGTMIGGHVGEGCEVGSTVELHLYVYKDDIARSHDDASGLWLLDV